LYTFCIAVTGTATPTEEIIFIYIAAEFCRRSRTPQVHRAVMNPIQSPDMMEWASSGEKAHLMDV
jgi:hypothetical protein